MADSRETGALENVGLTVKGLFQLVGIVVAVAATYYSLDQWVDNRLAEFVESYDARLISPKIAGNTYAISSNASSIASLQRENEKLRQDIKEMIEKQDNARNRQYGELKSILNEQQNDMKKIVTHLLVNK